jgi:arsenate reductase
MHVAGLVAPGLITRIELPGAKPKPMRLRARAMHRVTNRGAINVRQATSDTNLFERRDDSMGKPKVLFLCTGNSARSQMAEALLRNYAGEHFEVYSAGLEPRGINPLTIQAMEEMGLDLSKHTSKDVYTFIGKINFDYMITVCGRAEDSCPIFPGMGTRLHWDIEDPSKFAGTQEEKLAKFREVRDRLDHKIRLWLSQQGIPTSGKRVPVAVTD